MVPIGINAARPDVSIDNDEIYSFEERVHGGTGMTMRGCQFLTEELAQGSHEGFLDNKTGPLFLFDDCMIPKIRNNKKFSLLTNSKMKSKV